MFPPLVFKFAETTEEKSSCGVSTRAIQSFFRSAAIVDKVNKVSSQKRFHNPEMMCSSHGIVF
nr:MAG TPA: hypothetical protein [Caudoviricetes sp.]